MKRCKAETEEDNEDYQSEGSDRSIEYISHLNYEDLTKEAEAPYR